MSVLVGEDLLLFSPDGTQLASVDNTGHLRTFNTGPYLSPRLSPALRASCIPSF